MSNYSSPLWADYWKGTNDYINRLKFNKANNNMIEVNVIKDGPVIIKSNEGTKVTDENGKITPCFSPVAICRCGKSKDGNFCDGSHKKKKDE